MNLFEFQSISNDTINPQEFPRKFGLQIALTKSLTTY